LVPAKRYNQPDRAKHLNKTRERRTHHTVTRDALIYHTVIPKC
jgi:hypothetical protein